MAITTTVEKMTSSVKLDNGTTSTGTVRTISVGIGQLKEDAWDAQKAYNIAMALAPCLSKSFYELQQVVTNSIAEE